MKEPKFIIEHDTLILSKCVYHKDLTISPDVVKGGGYFRFNDNAFTFYGTSHDFGQASVEDIKEAIENDLVFTNLRYKNSIAKKYKFYYDSGEEITKLN